MKKVLLLLGVMSQLSFGLVTITPVEIGENKGFVTNAELGLQNREGNVKKENYNAAIRVTYDEAKNYVTWVEFDGEYGKSNGVANTNEKFIHFRYIHSMGPNNNFRYEIFSQLESDEFKKINSRKLLGAGIRYNLVKSYKDSKGYFGLSLFNENIDYDGAILSEDNTRVNTYLTYSVNLNKQTSFSMNLYYQPKVDDFSDYIHNTKAEIKTKLYKNVALKIAIGADSDSNPVSGVKKSNFSQKTTFVFNF